MAIQTLTLNVNAQPSAEDRAFLYLSQNENGRDIRFRVLGDDLPSGCTATLSGVKPDGNVWSKAGTVTNNFVVVEEDIQMTAVAGRWDAQLDIVNGSKNIVTALIRITVEAAAVEAGAVPSDTQLEGYVEQCKQYAETTKNEAYGSPLTAATAAAMTDQSRVYVYTGSETGYTAGHWYYYNGTSWTDGGVYNAVAVDTDTTLSVSGKAADAKKTGDELSTIKEDLSEYEGIFTADVDESVQNWLDDHPEATTTVQDGSLVKAKFSAELQKETLKDYAHYIYSEADFESIGANNASWILAQDITITQPIDSFSGNKFFDLNGHKITLANDYDAEYIFALGSNITLSNESKTARAIFNGTIDCKDIDCSVFHVDICWRLSLTDVIILNNVRGLFTYTDTATYGARGAENVLKNVAIYHSIGDSTARCGLHILMGDSLFFGVFPVGFQTGVQVNGVNNLLIGVHPWGYPRQDANPYSESLIMYIGFKIMTAKHMLIGCCADTFEPIDTSSDVSYENGGIGFYCCASYCVLTSCKTIVHSNSNSNKHVSFYFSDINPNTGLNKYLYGCSLADPRIDLNNDKTPYKQTPLYLQVPKVYVMRTNFPLYDGSNVLYAAITMAEGFSLASRSYLYRDGSHIRGRLIVVKDSGTISSSQTSVLTFNDGFKPTATYDGGCFLGVGQWDVKAVGYFYMSQTDVKIADKNASATYTAAYIDLDYTIDFQ